jgi:hypothetical protein
MDSDVSDKMLNKTLATVYYTPINEPENIKRIVVETEKDYKLVKGFIVKNTKRKRNPTLEPFQSSELSEIDVIKRIKEDYPSIKDDYVKHLFDYFTAWMYTSAKSKEKYFGLLVNHDFIFIYHFKPGKSITFKGTEIEEFVKYLNSFDIPPCILKSTSTVSLNKPLNPIISKVFSDIPVKFKCQIFI